jgi:hypothetical protein
MSRGGIGSLSYHNDVAVPLEQAPIPFAHHRMIIHQQHAERFLIVVHHCALQLPPQRDRE